MTRDEYLTTKNERNVLKEEIISLCGYVTKHPDEYRERVETLLTLTRVLDRAAAEYAANNVGKDSRDIMSFLPDGREIDYQNGD